MKITRFIALILIIASLITSSLTTAKAEENNFELPLDGATGYAIADINLRQEASSKSNKLNIIPAGAMFVIHEDCGNYMRVTYQDTPGYAIKALVMINLPDIIPSIKYINSNAKSSLFKSSGYNLDNITGQKLYPGKTWNARLRQEEYNMPVLYATAQKLAAAQQTALADNNCILLYEAYRPIAVQKLVNTELAKLMQQNSKVRKNINDGTWGKNWFIAKSISNHQMGFAVDISLGKIITTNELELTEDLKLNIPDEIQEFQMPTPMHELSNTAVALKYPVNSLSKTAWKNVKPAATMTEDAKLLQQYLVTTGMTPLPSEWWHFNDLDARAALKKLAAPNGQFEITGNCSKLITEQTYA